MQIEDGATYKFRSYEPHADNSETMCVFLEDHLDVLGDFTVTLVDGTYSEILDNDSGDKFEVHASVEMEILTITR